MSDSLPNTKAVVSGVFTTVAEYGRLVGDLASGDDYVYNTAFPAFCTCVKSQAGIMAEMMDACCGQLPKRRRVSLKPNAAGLTEDKRRTAVMDAIDSLLENVDTLLDEVRGNKLREQDQLAVTFGSELSSPSHSGPGAEGAAGAGPHGRVVVRPQLTFETPVDNSTEPFRPVYYDAEGKKHVGEPHVHPFAKLTESFHYPTEQLTPSADTPYLPLAACPFLFVDTVEDMKIMCEELRKEKEIAVDLEHHDYYSFQGFTCLMQISSRSKDYVVDCLKLRSSMHLLAPIFLDPSVLKVLHGAQEDIRWLQKDFGLYVVNMFDTGIALQTLHMPYGLAFAVDHFCQVKLNKKYQTADWRLRPIPAEMVSYARQDTHFLLYCYDRLKAMLLNSEGRAVLGNLLIHVLNESRQLCLTLYEKPQLDPNTTFKVALRRSTDGLAPVQLHVARDIFNWRDAAAREADDSPAAIMHLSAVLSIASKLPQSARDVLACCSPVSVTVRKHLAELVNIVKTHTSDMDLASRNGVSGVKRKRTAADGSDTAAEEDAGADSTPSLPQWRDYAAAAHTLGWYRPMTGVLPSIESVANAAPPAVEVLKRSQSAASTSAAVARDSVVLWEAKPSPWFAAIQKMATVMRNKASAKIPIPGSDTLQLVLKPRAAKTANAAQAASSENANAARAKDSDDNDDSGEEGDEESVANRVAEERAKEEEETAASESNTGSAGKQSETRMTVEESAVSLRQRYGTGKSNRRQAASAANTPAHKK